MCSYTFRLRDNYFLDAAALALFFLGLLPICICSFQNYVQIIYFMQLQFWRISELNLHTFWGGEGNCVTERTHRVFSQN